MRNLWGYVSLPEAKKPCFRCGVPKPEKDYGPAVWKARNADRRCCRDCVLKLRGYWSGAECSERKPHAEFTAWQESRDYSQNGTQLCNTCISLALVCHIARRANQRLVPTAVPFWSQDASSALLLGPCRYRARMNRMIQDRPPSHLPRCHMSGNCS